MNISPAPFTQEFIAQMMVWRQLARRLISDVRVDCISWTSIECTDKLANLTPLSGRHYDLILSQPLAPRSGRALKTQLQARDLDRWVMTIKPAAPRLRWLVQ